jgi:hypothetical protein
MAAAAQTITVYRLRDAENVALHIAEVNGVDDKTLIAVGMALHEYEQKREYLASAITKTVYTFIRHDLKSTKALEVANSVQENQELGRQKTNALTRDALSSVAQGIFMLCVGPGAAVIPMGYLTAVTPGGQFNVSHLARYLA